MHMKPLLGESVESLKIIEPENPEGWARLVLPPGEPATGYRHARYRTGHALFTIDSRESGREIRIPLVDREEPGDFRRLMDRLTAVLAVRTVRFVNVHTDDDPIAEAWESLYDATDTRPLGEALNDYELLHEDWPGQAEPIKCFLVEWNQDR